MTYLLGVLYGWDKIKAALLKYEELNGDFFVPWKYVIPVHAETSGWPQGEETTTQHLIESYIHTYIHTYIYTYIHTHIHTYIQISISRHRGGRDQY